MANSSFFWVLLFWLYLGLDFAVFCMIRYCIDFYFGLYLIVIHTISCCIDNIMLLGVSQQSTRLRSGDALDNSLRIDRERETRTGLNKLQNIREELVTFHESKGYQWDGLDIEGPDLDPREAILGYPRAQGDAKCGSIDGSLNKSHVKALSHHITPYRFTFVPTENNKRRKVDLSETVFELSSEEESRQFGSIDRILSYFTFNTSERGSHRPKFNPN